MVLGPVLKLEPTKLCTIMVAKPDPLMGGGIVKGNGNDEFATLGLELGARPRLLFKKQ
jgi:hypothetical protein